ncbi:MAG: ribosome small subunit-dependent GTPase, partial [Deltaproteobacteria bacterium]|nr:ribosome small subunit-dependent GTPase [Deltaproteobacteria bacterium]
MTQTGTIVRHTKSFYYVDVGEIEPRLCGIRGNLFKESSYINKIAVG